MIAEKRDIGISDAVKWLRNKISFSLLRSMLICVRGSRSIKRRELTLKDIDISLTNEMSSIREL